MPHLTCDWAHSADVKHLKTAINTTVSNSSYNKASTVLFSVYNIHSLWERFRVHTPVTAACELKTDLALAESEESFVRYNHLFNPSFHYFDGNSTTLPTASLQRIYKEAILNVTDIFLDPRNFTSLIKEHRTSHPTATRETAPTPTETGMCSSFGTRACVLMV